MTYDEIKDLLSKERAERGLSYSQISRAVARHLGRELSRQAVYNWEVGRSRAGYEELQAWSKALGFAFTMTAVRFDDPLPARMASRVAKMPEADRSMLLDFLEILAVAEGTEKKMLTGLLRGVADQVRSPRSEKPGQ